jgi:galactosylceramidase
MAIVISINDSDTGRVFAGIGGVTSNGMTRLLRDYPSEQQHGIIDMLFKPKFGASLHLLKIEIGSDANGTAGTEPSHMRSETDFDITRGIGLWLGREAKIRNSAILLDAIRWGTPGWITTDMKKYLYYKNFLLGARDTFGLEFDYLASDENEGAFSRNFVVNTLRPGLDRDGFAAVKLTAADSTSDWNIVPLIKGDPALKNALAAINIHYKQDSPEEAKSCGLPVFDSEDLAPFRRNFSSCLNVAHRIIRSYASGKMVMYQIHPLLEAVYDNTPYTYKGIIAAAFPWTGYYEIDPGLWIIAHFTQFFSPGWIYVDSGCSSNPENSLITLKNPETNDFSIVILNRGPASTEYFFNLTGISADKIHGWGSDENEQFYRIDDIIPRKGSFVVMVPPAAIYTLTTTTGQQKGKPAAHIPDASSFSLPYSDTFEGYELGKQPRYAVDQAGAFEITNKGRNGGNCLEQVITLPAKPVDWAGRASPSPYTLLGNQRWKNYVLSVDIFIDEPEYLDYDGYALAGARCNFAPTGNKPPECYHVLIFYDGRWQLRRGAFVLDSGIIPNFILNRWYSVKLILVDDTIQADFNGNLLSCCRDQEIPSGQIVLGSGYNRVRFDNLLISPVKTGMPVECLRYEETEPLVEYTGSWKQSGVNANNSARSLIVSDQRGDSMEFTFNGSALSILGYSGTGCGQAYVYFDNEPQRMIDTYAESPKYRKSLYSVYYPLPGNHNVKLVVAGTKNFDSSGTSVYIDALEIYGGTGLIPGGSPRR